MSHTTELNIKKGVLSFNDIKIEFESATMVLSSTKAVEALTINQNAAPRMPDFQPMQDSAPRMQTASNYRVVPPVKSVKKVESKEQHITRPCPADPLILEYLEKHGEQPVRKFTHA